MTDAVADTAATQAAAARAAATRAAATDLAPVDRREVDARLIAGLYRRVKAMLFANFGALVLLTVALWPSADRAALLLWAGTLSAWTLLRFGLARLYLRRPRAVEETWRWTLAFAAGSGVAGTLWGLSTLLIGNLESDGEKLATAFVMAALSAAAIAGYTNSLLAFAAFTAPSLLPYGLKLVWLDGGFDPLIAAFVVFWGLLLAVMARHLNAGFREGLTLSTQNAKLAERLGQERDRADAANRAKTRFLGHMSHELRTPLNAVVGYAEMMAHQVFGPLGHDKYAAYAADIEASGRDLMGMVDRVLHLADLEAGKADLDEGPVALGTLLDGVAAAEQERVGARRLQVVVSAPDGLPRLLADQTKLATMLDGLMSNAVTHSVDGGRIDLAAELGSDGGVLLSVIDAGPGMTPEQRARALVPFAPLDARDHLTAADARTGSGLGLPLVRLLAELHGGRLELAEPGGGGLRATLVFPPERSLQPESLAAE